jgi:hypothetical protein
VFPVELRGRQRLKAGGARMDVAQLTSERGRKYLQSLGYKKNQERMSWLLTILLQHYCSFMMTVLACKRKCNDDAKVSHSAHF